MNSNTTPPSTYHTKQLHFPISSRPVTTCDSSVRINFSGTTNCQQHITIHVLHHSSSVQDFWGFTTDVFSQAESIRNKEQLPLATFAVIAKPTFYISQIPEQKYQMVSIYLLINASLPF
uniref:Uncharacterized protein n=1 Tax=Octopus bimaculoides TaxID=37653 RepID=A0A0L8GLB5_OCTBM